MQSLESGAVFYLALYPHSLAVELGTSVGTSLERLALVPFAATPIGFRDPGRCWGLSQRGLSQALPVLMAGRAGERGVGGDTVDGGTVVEQVRVLTGARRGVVIITWMVTSLTSLEVLVNKKGTVTRSPPILEMTVLPPRFLGS